MVKKKKRQTRGGGKLPLQADILCDSAASLQVQGGNFQVAKFKEETSKLPSKSSQFHNHARMSGQAHQSLPLRMAPGIKGGRFLKNKIAAGRRLCSPVPGVGSLKEGVTEFNLLRKSRKVSGQTAEEYEKRLELLWTWSQEPSFGPHRFPEAFHELPFAHPSYLDQLLDRYLTQIFLNHDTAGSVGKTFYGVRWWYSLSDKELPLTHASLAGFHNVAPIYAADPMPCENNPLTAREMLLGEVPWAGLAAALVLLVFDSYARKGTDCAVHKKETLPPVSLFAACGGEGVKWLVTVYTKVQAEKYKDLHGCPAGCMDGPHKTWVTLGKRRSVSIVPTPL